MAEHGSGPASDEASSSVDSSLPSGASVRPFHRRHPRVVLAVLLLLLALAGLWGYGQAREGRKQAWIGHLRERGLIVSRPSRFESLGSSAGLRAIVYQLLTGDHVTIHSEGPRETQELLSAPPFPGGLLSIMLPYEPSADVLTALKERYPHSSLLIFSRATRTGRQAW
jgi:hypothetical protein